jgi:hypothetical protein
MKKGTPKKQLNTLKKNLGILKELAGKKPENLHYQYEISNNFNDLEKLFEDIGDIERAKECHMQEIKSTGIFKKETPKTS